MERSLQSQARVLFRCPTTILHQSPTGMSCRNLSAGMIRSPSRITPERLRRVLLPALPRTPRRAKSRSEIDHSRYYFWRLSHLVRTEVDTVKLLRSTLVFVMSATFDADLSKIERDTGSLLPWSVTISTKYANSSAVHWWNVSKITQSLALWYGSSNTRWRTITSSMHADSTKI
jgi:hypothetical protein